MADDPRQPPDDRGVDGVRGVPEGRPPDPGRAGPPPAAASGPDPTPPDETVRQPGPPDETSRQPGAPDETVRQPRAPDETVRQPRPPDTTVPMPPREPAWSGRAGVPPRRVEPPRQPQPDWNYDAEPDDRRWWMPILVGTVALILLGVLVVAGWAIIDSARRDTPTSPSPVLTTPAAPTAPTTGPPTTGPPTTAAPTPSATTAGAGPVLVPPLVGLSQQEAVAELERLGLVPRIQPQTSSRTPGTVLDTDPSTGSEVLPGSEVVLVVAVPPTGPPTTVADPVGPTQPTPGG